MECPWLNSLEALVFRYVFADRHVFFAAPPSKLSNISNELNTFKQKRVTTSYPLKLEFETSDQIGKNVTYTAQPVFFPFTQQLGCLNLYWGHLTTQCVVRPILCGQRE